MRYDVRTIVVISCIWDRQNDSWCGQSGQVRDSSSSWSILHLSCMHIVTYRIVHFLPSGIAKVKDAIAS